MFILQDEEIDGTEEVMEDKVNKETQIDIRS